MKNHFWNVAIGDSVCQVLPIRDLGTRPEAIDAYMHYWYVTFLWNITSKTALLTSSTGVNSFDQIGLISYTKLGMTKAWGKWQ